MQIESPVTFICKVEDSIKSHFRYIWGISGVKNAETDTNFWETTAPDSAGEYNIGVTVRDEDPETQSVSEIKEFTVIDTTTTD